MKIERYRNDNSIMAKILDQSAMRISITSEETTIIRFTNKPTSNGITNVNTAPTYLLIRTLCRQIAPANIKRNVPASLSPQKLS